MYINQCYNVSSGYLDDTAILIILQCLFGGVDFQWTDKNNTLILQLDNITIILICGEKQR